MGNSSADRTPGPGTLPWTKSCFVCGEDNPHGLRLKSRLEGGSVVLTYRPREADLGWRHTVHGGITIALLDEVMTWASIIAFRSACVAAEITTRLRKPIVPSRSFRVEGRIARADSRLAMAEGEIRDDSGEVYALATGKYMTMPAARLADSAQDFVLGPDVIHPDEIFTSQRS